MVIEAQGLDPCKPPRLDLYVAGAPGTDRDRLLDILIEMRRAGVSADADTMERGLKAQMKQADRLQARLVMIIGPDELERGEATVRDLDRSEQWNVPIKQATPRVKDYLARAEQPPAEDKDSDG